MFSSFSLTTLETTWIVMKWLCVVYMREKIVIHESSLTFLKTFANSCYWAPRGSLRCFDDDGWSRRLEEGCLKLKLRDYESKWKLLRLRLKLISLDHYLWTNVTFMPIIYQIEGNEKIYEKGEKKKFIFKWWLAARFKLCYFGKYELTYFDMFLGSILVVFKFFTSQ